MALRPTDTNARPGRRQSIIQTNAEILIGPLWTNFSEIVSKLIFFIQ